jgi:hypothetical protein
VIFLVVAVVLGGIAAASFAVLANQPKKAATITTPTPTPSPTPKPTPITKASPLSGALVDPALANRPVRAVVIENHPDARPQSGLSQAGVVYEALAEGGITRFLAFFLENQPTAIGPVRSLRPYFNDWTLEFGAPISHAGGSATALGQVGQLGVHSLNALVIGAPIFYRTSDRLAPHNLYTSSALQDQLLASRGFNAAATFTPTPRQADKPNANPPHPNIHIEYSYNGFQADYAYSAATNDYARSVGGKAHIDRGTGQQIHVKNVVVEFTSVVALADGHMQIQTTGQGSGVLFRDGEAIPCTWSKASRNERTKLLGADGKELALDVGNTWYSIVPTGKKVTY